MASTCRSVDRLPTAGRPARARCRAGRPAAECPRRSRPATGAWRLRPASGPTQRAVAAECAASPQGCWRLRPGCRCQPHLRARACLRPSSVRLLCSSYSETCWPQSIPGLDRSCSQLPPIARHKTALAGGLDATHAAGRGDRRLHGPPRRGFTWALIPVIGTPRRCVAIHTDQIVYRSDLMS
jgi:hypothetical protein